MKNKLLIILGVIVLSSFSISELRSDIEAEEVRTEFCNYGNLGECRPIGTWIGFRCYLTQYTPDCAGSRHVDLE